MRDFDVWSITVICGIGGFAGMVAGYLAAAARAVVADWLRYATRERA